MEELPAMLAQLAAIPDPRDPKKSRHKLTVLLLDGLYANGPVMQRCRAYHWQFMIVLKDKDLPTVWQEFNALQGLNPQTLQQTWGKRRQCFSWVNHIDYAFGPKGRQHLKLHLV